MSLEKRDYDAVIVGSGPNGLAAGILLQQQGLSVLIIEGKDQIGGGLSTQELTLPGFKHDVCSAIHPMAVASPFFKTLPLNEHGLEYIYPTLAAAHPFDDGTAAVLEQSIQKTAANLGGDAKAYQLLMQSVTAAWPLIDKDALGPLHFPSHPLAMAGFGLKALTSASYFVDRFKEKHARGLFAGMAAHSIQPLNNLSTTAIGLVLMATGHLKGWPIPKGGSASIANALGSYFKSIGGTIQMGTFISDLQQLPSAHAVLFDITPKQLLKIAGHRFSNIYKWQLARYRYGMGVYKIDWALDGPIPYKAEACRQAGTIHLGNTFEEIAEGELQTSKGFQAEKPFVLLAQQSLFDQSRAPEGKQTAWAYCHVPNGSTQDLTGIIEKQVERFAPGFRDRILARHTMDTAQMEAHNPNYVGGDINGGILDIGQLFTRPALRWSPYKTSARGLYICSSSTPPGGGVHGMAGYNAAKQALKDIFKIEIK
ncbi:phytoene desaturase family protein [Pedobacter rhizosphaerae]|uniref:Phytoene dehydrogenase-related protein n=1 Tax=Pedobacter rhizosphaerae TaxID=390241 RepID=A0A1H9U0X8_9SPHI|nr:NAD(P)/FAD-dependent oxidoreductase [Pedobacter rhizosphaerae]SES03019.1 Phytoene dehydrogenase-related protein [Pedobacter rhizosphaerae]